METVVCNAGGVVEVWTILRNEVGVGDDCILRGVEGEASGRTQVAGKTPTTPVIVLPVHQL